MVKRFAFMGLVALVFTLLFGLTASHANAANETFVVKVSLQEWHVDMSSATVPVGVPVRFEITNNGKIPHELVLEEAGAVDDSLSVDVNGEEVAAEAENIQPGDTKTMTWTFTEPGAYQAACHIKSHFEAGMKVAFTVGSASDNASATQAHTPAAIYVAKGKGGVLVHNYYGKELNFSMDDAEFQVPANSDLFIALEPDTYNYSANVAGDDDSERMDAVDVQAGGIAELSFYH